MPPRLLTNRFKSDSFQHFPCASERNTSRPISRVLSPWGLTHSVWPFIWSLRCRKLHATNPGGEPKTVLHTCACVPPLFGLAPGGVCHAKLVAKFAVRSYRTVSPSPRVNSRQFIFCGTFPGVTPAGRYPAPYSRGARTFLPCTLSSLARAAIQPTGGLGLGAANEAVNKSLAIAPSSTMFRSAYGGPSHDQC